MFWVNNIATTYHTTIITDPNTTWWRTRIFENFALYKLLCLLMTIDFHHFTVGSINILWLYSLNWCVVCSQQPMIGDDDGHDIDRVHDTLIHTFTTPMPISVTSQSPCSCLVGAKQPGLVNIDVDILTDTIYHRGRWHPSPDRLQLDPEDLIDDCANGELRGTDTDAKDMIDTMIAMTTMNLDHDDHPFLTVWL